MPNDDEKSVLISFGGAVKALADGRVGGYLARFTKPGDYDVVADRFDKTETDFGLGENATIPILYNHGLDVKIGRKRIGSGATRIDDVGLWVEAQLKLRDEYEKKIWELAQQGKLGWSSGAAAHTVERKNETKGALVTQWFIAEASLTPIPAEPRNAVVALKSLSVSDLSAEDAGNASRKSQADDSKKQGAIEMDEKDILALLEKREQEKVAAVKALADAEATKAAQAEALKTMVQETVAATLGGVVQKPIAGKAVNLNLKTEKGFADDAMKGFLHYVQTGRKNGALIPAHLTAEDMRDPGMKAAMQGQTDSEGGYAVPDDFATSIASKRDEVSVARICGITPVPTTLDRYLFPTEGTAATYSVVTAEEGSYDENEPTLGQVAVTVYKHTKLIKISEELEADAKAGFGTWLANVWGRAQGLAENRAVFNVASNGSSKPQSVTYAATATTAVASQTVVTAAEVLALIYAVGSAYSDNLVMVMRRATLGGIRGLQGNPFNFIPNNNFSIGEGNANTASGLAGYIHNVPVYCTDDLPAQAAANRPIVIFNPDFYGMVEREGIVVVRNPYLYQASGQVGLFMRHRFGGALLQGDAAYYLLSKT